MLNSGLYRKKVHYDWAFRGVRGPVSGREIFPIQDFGFRERGVFSTKFYSEIVLWLVLSLIRILKKNLIMIMMMIMIITITIITFSTEKTRIASVLFWSPEASTPSDLPSIGGRHATPYSLPSPSVPFN